MMKSLPVAALLILATVPPSAAQDEQPYMRDPCAFFCKLLRNVSGKVHVPVPHAEQEGDVVDGPLPTVEEEASRPDVRRLVVVHGDILKKTVAERARERKDLAQTEKRIDTLRPVKLVAQPSVDQSADH